MKKKNKLTRRRFLGTTSMVVAGMIFYPLNSCSGSSQRNMELERPVGFSSSKIRFSMSPGYKAIAAYEKAFEYEKDEPIFYEELDKLYEMSNASIDKRLKLFEGSNEIVSKRDDAFARQIAVLTLAGQADKAVEYLSGKQFSYREGSGRVREFKKFNLDF